jgi:endonuclease III
MKKDNTSTATDVPMGKVLDILQAVYPEHPMGEMTGHDPYRVLIACLLSLRTRDDVMIPASKRLFAVADTPEAMIRLTPEEIQKLIRPVGFYQTKSQRLIDISRRILDEFGGKVPDTMDELLSFHGVGRKTANLVLGLGYGLPAVCVDTHVHRICNRLGYVQTADPDKTEMALRAKLPQKYWPIINKVLVLHGQNICKPIGPRCNICPVAKACLKVGVKTQAAKAHQPGNVTPC